MRDEDRQHFGSLVRAAFQTMLQSPPVNSVLWIWWGHFMPYTIQQFESAIIEYTRTGKYPPKPSDIISIIESMSPDGRPGIEEAWAMIPKSEYDSAAVTTEMAEAWGIASGLYEVGDTVAARMSFKQSYERLVDQNKRAGIPPKWFPSLGHDYEGRQLALKEAERLGRLSGSHVQMIGHHETPPLIAQAASLLIENKSVEMTAEQRAKNKQRIYEIKKKFLNKKPNTGNEPGRRD